VMLNPTIGKDGYHDRRYDSRRGSGKERFSTPWGLLRQDMRSSARR
jgi:hypothetical protein